MSERLGRDKTLARLALFSFRLTATFCERACLGFNTRQDLKRKGGLQAGLFVNKLRVKWNESSRLTTNAVSPGKKRQAKNSIT